MVVTLIFALCSCPCVQANSTNTQDSYESPLELKNILFIVVDDLRLNIAAYGSSFMHTPHMDTLAAQGMLFQRAYVQYSFCAPSRNSFMTGRRPDATQAWSFRDHFREVGVGDKWTSMPQYFKNHGYTVFGTGKLFHPGLPPSFDATLSWDEFNWPGGCTGNTNGWPVLEPNVKNVVCVVTSGNCNNKTGAIVAQDSNGTRWCAIDTTKLKNPLADDLVVTAAVDYLERAVKQSKPFFIGVGFHKPHLPFAFPKEFGELYPTKVAPPAHNLPPKGMPLCAWHEGNFNNLWDAPCKDPSEYRRAYYSAVSYTDSNIGKVLAKLDSLKQTTSTAVILIGDHGWQLGEMNEWRKMTNFELGVRVPLLFRVPWKPASLGVKSPALVEAVDLFPTMVSLAGLPPVPSNETLQGFDISPLLDDPTKQLKSYAFSQFAKQFVRSKELKEQVAWGECTKCNRSDIDVHGYSVRSDEWRYTEWVSWNKTSLRPIWSEVVGRELYNHSGDYGSNIDKSTPTHNVWNTSDVHKEIVANLSIVIHKQFNNDHVPPDKNIGHGNMQESITTQHG